MSVQRPDHMWEDNPRYYAALQAVRRKQGALDLVRPLMKAGLVKRVGTPKNGRYVLK